MSDASPAGKRFPVAPLVLGAAVIAALVYGARYFAEPAGDAAPAAGGNLGRMTDFPATERSGRTMRTADLHGRFVVADFIFTSCDMQCPRLEAQMKTLADLPDVQLVSFSVDPARDTPEKLASYAERFGADPQRWLFLVPSETDLRGLLVDELHLTAPSDPAFHIDRFVLFDPSGAARGVYRPLDDAGWRAKLVADVTRLRTAAH